MVLSTVICTLTSTLFVCAFFCIITSKMPINIIQAQAVSVQTKLIGLYIMTRPHKENKLQKHKIILTYFFQFKPVVYVFRRYKSTLRTKLTGKQKNSYFTSRELCKV